jgi:predicted nucleic acid-binding protein
MVVQYVANPQNIQVAEHMSRWVERQEWFIAPVLHGYEVLNGLHRYAATRQLSVAAVDAARRDAAALQVELVYDPQDHDRALELARRFNRPVTYDAHYLAVADRLGIELWTADKRLYNSVQHQLSWVHLVGDPSTP